MPKFTITLEVECKNSIEKAGIEAELKKYVSLDQEDRGRIYQLIESSKALKALKQYWGILSLKFK